MWMIFSLLTIAGMFVPVPEKMKERTAASKKSIERI
jgi:hypothetical protein